MFDHQHHVGTSGLDILQIPMPGVKSATVMVMVNTGSRYEQPREEGIAHFFEHMVFKGTSKYPDPQKLAAAIDGLGADFNAFTSKEYTGYYVKAAAKHLNIALDVVSDMLLQPELRQEDIDREKGVIIEEINMYQDTPMRYIANLFEQMFFRGSGLSHDVLGSKKTVSELDRADFLHFIQQWYGPGNMVVIVAGDDAIVGTQACLDDIERAFSKKPESLRPKDKVKISKFVASKNGNSGKSPIAPHRLHLQTKATEQAHFVLGWPGIDRNHSDRYPLTVLGVILGGNMSSRLFTEVREKRGLCYYVRSEVDYFHDAGIFGASAGVDPGRIHEALEVVIAEFHNLASGKNKITADELSKAKEYLTGSMILDLEDSRSVAQYFGLKRVLTSKIESPEEALAKIQSVTLGEVAAIAKKLVTPNGLRLVLIGPYENKAEFEKFVA